MDSSSKLALDSFFLHCQSKRLTDKTMEVYEERIGYLRRFASERDRNLLDLRKSDVQEYFLDIGKRVSGTTINGRVKMYRILYKYFIENELIEHNPIEGIPTVRCEKRAKPVVSPDDFKRVIRALRENGKKSFYTVRSEVMLLVSYDCMLRLNELLSLEEGNISIRDRSLTVFGKGRKERILAFSAYTANRLLLYLAKKQFRNIPGSLIFPTRDGKKILKRNGHHIFVRAGMLADPPVKLSPHKIRHSSATNYYELTNNIILIRDILGHRDVTVTQQYLHGGGRQIVRAYERVTPISDLDL